MDERPSTVHYDLSPRLYSDGTMKLYLLFSCAFAFFLLSIIGPRGAEILGAENLETVISKAVQDDGVFVHSITSPYQAGTTHIRVLLPDHLEPGKRYQVLYVLPVEAGDGCQYGNGLREIHRRHIQNQHDLICVAPTFSHLPWYADHPTDAEIRQETYFLKTVIPLVEKCYPAMSKTEGRLLVGFSKSGWGAFSLLLRHSDMFAKAAAWDAPLMMSQPSRYSMCAIFGGQENFEQFRICSLLNQHAKEFLGTKRFILTGYGNFRLHHRATHKLMKQLQVGHTYRDGPKIKHRWDSGWLSEAVELLVRPPCLPMP